MDTNQIITYATTYPGSIAAGAAGGLVLAALAGSICCCCYCVAPGSIRRATDNLYIRSGNMMNRLFGRLPRYSSGSIDKGTGENAGSGFRVSKNSAKGQGFNRLTDDAQAPGISNVDHFEQGDLELGEVVVENEEQDRNVTSFGFRRESE